MNKERFQPLQWFIGFSTITFVLLSALALGANRPVFWSLLTFVVLVLFALQVFRALITRLPQQLRGVWLVGALYLSVLAWAVVQTLPALPSAWAHPVWRLVEGVPVISADPGMGAQGVVRLSLYAMVFMICAWTFTKPRAALWGLRLIAVWSTVLAIYGFYVLATGYNPILDQASRNVMTASFVNRNSYATYAVFGALANLGAYLNMINQRGQADDRRRWRNMIEGFFGGAWLFAIGTLLCVAAVALTASRGGAVAGLVGLITVAIAWAANPKSEENTRSSTSGLFIFVGLTLLVGFIAYASSSVLIGRLVLDSGEDFRFAIYPLIIDAIMERPWLGHGLGAFQDVFRASVPPEGGFAEWDMAHNSYLENAFELGLPAAAAFYLALAAIGLRLIHGVRTRRRDRIYPCVALGCYVTAMVHSTVDFGLQMPATAALFAGIMALGWSQSFSETSRRRNAVAG